MSEETCWICHRTKEQLKEIIEKAYEKKKDVSEYLYPFKNVPDWTPFELVSVPAFEDEQMTVLVCKICLQVMAFQSLQTIDSELEIGDTPLMKALKDFIIEEVLNNVVLQISSKEESKN